jgi:hypothetical protein
MLLSLGVVSHRSATALAAARPQIALETALPPAGLGADRHAR